MAANRIFSPLALPIYGFALAILLGGILLHMEFSAAGEPVSFLDALFTATSATCVTGLAVVDTGTVFSRAGQVVIVSLIQLGGLGIMTYTSLAFYLWRRRVTMTDITAVGESLLHDPSFRLGSFLTKLVAMVGLTELAGAVSLYLFDPEGFTPFNAVFHSVSAFCNAGFSNFPDNLAGYVGHAGVNLTIMALITLGGLGFSTLIEVEGWARSRLKRPTGASRPRLSWYARIVLSTSLFLVLTGAAAIYAGEYLIGQAASQGFKERLLASLFQSVTCRTAGFNTVDIGAMTNFSLTVMMFLMFVGGSPASCAGGIKTTTFRVLTAFSLAQFMGREQTVVRDTAVDPRTLNKAITLSIFAFCIVGGATLALCFTEAPADTAQSKGLFIESIFEVISAFGTVGLSTGLTPKLSSPGKAVIILVMFIGRIGPIAFLSFLQALQEPPRYRWPEEGMLIG
jgi:trk system potassium uptake protein TrkH